jgi:hypothetical protein
VRKTKGNAFPFGYFLAGYQEKVFSGFPLCQHLIMPCDPEKNMV